MKLKNKKMIAPIAIAVLISLFCIGYTIACFLATDFSLVVKIILTTIPAAIAGVCIYVMIERIKEIRSGIEDDLGKY